MTYSDQELLAFLDGRLDEKRTAEIEQTMRIDQDLETRVMDLDPVAAPVRDAMKALPGDHVLMDLKRAAPFAPQAKASSWQWSKLAAVLVLGALLGSGAMWFGQPAPEDWRSRIAQYQSLYVAETVRLTTASAETLERQLDAAVDTLGRPLEQQGLDAPALLSLARVQVLGLDDEPLIQIVYQADDGRPFALCITTGTGAGDPDVAKSEMFHGLATTAWHDGSFRYILVGGKDLTETEQLALQLKAFL